MGRVRSNISPLILAARAASARRGLMPRAISMGRVSAATDCLLPSGRVISILLIGNFQRSTWGRSRTWRHWPIGQGGGPPRPGYHEKDKVYMAASSMTGIDESALVAQAREGDTIAFGELVRRYEGKIFRLAQHVTQNREDAEDVLQETFMKAYEHLDQFKGDSKFYTWIVRIAVNQALMKLRRRKTDKSVSLDETIDTGEDTVTREIAAWDENPEQQFSRDELGGILDTAIQSLEPPYRSVFVLRDIEELSMEETAEALGLSVPAVKSRLLRARLQLREKLTRFFKRKGDDAFAYM